MAAGKFNRDNNAGTAVCTVCGQRKQKANMERTNAPEAICTRCFNKAGDENSVSDGYLAETEFVERWGEPSGW